METVLKEVARERVRQELKWGGPAHDDTHSRADWIEFIDQRLAYPEKADQCSEYRRDMIEIAALAIAAVESLDRKELSA